MQGLIRMALALALLGPASPPAWPAQPGAALQRLPKAVQAVVERQGFPDAALGVYLYDLDADRPLLEVNAGQAFNPASTMKLVTTYAALNLLSPAYRWHTHAYVEHTPVDGVLEGDLYLKGEGDPFLVTEYFWQFLSGLRARGVRHVKGDLVIDASHFDVPAGDPGAFDARPHRAYNVLPAALLPNLLVTRFVFLADWPGQRVRIVADPPSDTLTIDNAVQLVKGACPAGPDRLTKVVKKGPDGTIVRFAGSFPTGCDEYAWSRAVSETQPYILGVFRALWRDLGGTLSGGIRTAGVPQEARRLHTQESRSLAEIVAGINEYSNNVMSRQLLLTVGAEVSGAPARVDKGVSAVRAWLAKSGIDMPALVMENGSGLARGGRLSPIGMAALLRHAWRSPYMPEFIASLPISGLEGTLRERFKVAPLAGRLHAKTGALKDVSALAGYLLTKRNTRVALVIMLNHPAASTRRGARVQAAILRWAYER